METYDFHIIIGFRVTADNKHDALQAALNAEASLNDSSIRGMYGGGTVQRVKAPTLGRFRQTNLEMPDNPVGRSRQDENSRYEKLLAPLRSRWTVQLEKDGQTFNYSIVAPTRERAIDKARVKLYHKKSHMDATVVSVEARNLTNSNR